MRLLKLTSSLLKNSSTCKYIRFKPIPISQFKLDSNNTTNDFNTNFKNSNLSSSTAVSKPYTPKMPEKPKNYNFLKSSSVPKDDPNENQNELSETADQDFQGPNQDGALNQPQMTAFHKKTNENDEQVQSISKLDLKINILPNRNSNSQSRSRAIEKEKAEDSSARSAGSLKRLRSISPSVSEAGSFCESELSFCQSTFESRRRKNEPIRIAIEGNIAAGKSTFISILQKISENDPNCNWYVQPEPLAKWTGEKDNKKGSNLLENFYKNPKRWAYTFEAYTFMTRMKQALDADREVQSEMKNVDVDLTNSNFSSITFFERSVYSSRLVFAENCYEAGDLSSIEWSIYCDWSNYLIKKVKQLKLDGLIYLRCDPKVCAARMKKRNRSEESAVPDEYLKALHNKYDTWLAEWLSDKIHNSSDDVFKFEVETERDSNESEGSKVRKKFTKALRARMDDTHEQVKKALNDVPILILNCSDEFESNPKNKEKMLVKVRSFLRKVEFLDDDEEFQPGKKSKSCGYTSHNSQELETESTEQSSTEKSVTEKTFSEEMESVKSLKMGEKVGSFKKQNNLSSFDQEEDKENIAALV